MGMIRAALLILCTTGLIAVSRVASAALPSGAGFAFNRTDAVDRINAAAPLSGSAKTALAEMQRLVSDPAVSSGIEAQLALKMQLRALTCDQSLTIDPSLPISVIHDRYGGAPCFASQDASIANWLGLRTVGYLVGLPALRPLASTPPQSIRDDVADIMRVHFAARAAIAVVGSYRDIEVIDLTRGTPINTRYTSEGGLLGSVSPNGRVYITRYNGQLRFYDSEDGTLLAEPEWGLYGSSCGFNWLDNETALITDPAPPTHPAALYDFRSGAIEPLNGELGQVCRVVPAPGASATFVAFANAGITQFKLIRGADSHPQVELIQVKHIKLNLIPGTGGLVAGGRQYVNTSNDELVITNLNDLRTESISFGRFRLQRAIPTANPDRILVAGYVPGGPSTWTFYEYATREQTLSRLDVDTLPSTQFVYDPVQAALFAQTHATLTLVDALHAGKPVSRDVFATHATRSGQLPVLPTFYAEPPGTAEVMTSGGMITRIIAPAAQAPAPHPMSRFAQGADIEGIAIPATPGSNLGKYVGTIPGSNVKIYRSIAGMPASAAGPPVVQVTVRARARPLVLVLATETGAFWRLDIKNGAHLTAILMTGPRSGSVQNQGSIPVFDIGRAYGCSMGSPDYMVMQNEVYASTGKRMNRFQCAQGLSRFTVY